MLELAQQRQHNAEQPISRLPLEVISEILLILFDGEEGKDAPKSRPCKYNTLSFCHLWRQCTLQLAALWTVLSISKSHRSEEDINYIRALGKRSGTLPIHIRLEVGENFEDIAAYMTEQLNDDVFARCWSFEIELIDEDCADGSFPLPFSMPSVKVVRLADNSDQLDVICERCEENEVAHERQPSWASVEYLFSPIPQGVRHVALDAMGPTPQKMFYFPNSIKYLEIGEGNPVSVEVVSELVHSSPFLEVLAVGSALGRTSTHSLRIHAPKLRRLGYAGARFGGFFPYMDAPNLETLHIGDHALLNEPEIIELSRKFSALNDLHMHYSGRSHQILHNLLKIGSPTCRINSSSDLNQLATMLIEICLSPSILPFGTSLVVSIIPTNRNCCVTCRGRPSSCFHEQQITIAYGRFIARLLSSNSDVLDRFSLHFQSSKQVVESLEAITGSNMDQIKDVKFRACDLIELLSLPLDEFHRKWIPHWRAL